MNKERLVIQIDVLRNINPGNFHMDAWIYGNQQCGTTCCAFGYAALDERLRAEGLGMHILLADTTIIEVASISEFNRQIANRINFAGVMPHYNGHRNFEAASAFYDISMADTRWVFDPDKYPDELHSDQIEPQHVIARIEQLLAR